MAGTWQQRDAEPAGASSADTRVRAVLARPGVLLLVANGTALVGAAAAYLRAGPVALWAVVGELVGLGLAIAWLVRRQHRGALNRRGGARSLPPVLELADNLAAADYDRVRGELHRMGAAVLAVGSPAGSAPVGDAVAGLARSLAEHGGEIMVVDDAAHELVVLPDERRVERLVHRVRAEARTVLFDLSATPPALSELLVRHVDVIVLVGGHSPGEARELDEPGTGRQVDPLVALPWLVLVATTVTGVAVGLASSLAVAYPVLCLAAALALHRRSPGSYVSLVLWLWLLTPLLRRVIDDQAGFSEVSPVLLAPYLATAVSLLPLIQNPSRLRLAVCGPFVLVGVAVLAGLVVALPRSGLVPSVYGLLDWLVPPALALWTVLHWRYYPVLARRVLTVALVGGVGISAYGVYQFLALPRWDAYWMDSVADVLGSIGRSEPLEVRVFGTMNAPGIFGMVVMVLALMLTARRGVSTPVALAVLALGLGLSLVRSAWLGFVVGLLTLFVYRRGAARVRSLAVAALTVPLFLVLVQSGPVGAVLSERLASVTDPAGDQSFQDRLAFLVTTSPQVLTQPLGYGIGATGAAARAAGQGPSQLQNFDNGLLEIPFTLGLLPGVLFLLGLGRVVQHAFTGLRAGDRGRQAFAAAAAAGLTQLFFVNALKGATGVFIWLALALAVAGGVHARLRASTATAATSAQPAAAPATAPSPVPSAATP